METNNSSPEVKSFVPYTGRAPILIQIVGGLLWLGATGVIVLGVIELLVNPIWGIVYIIIAVGLIITARSLFKMRRSAFRNGLIVATAFILLLGYVILFDSKTTSYTNFIYPVLLLIIIFVYKDRFVN
ncbi:MAG: hypothetical protein WCV79_00175 [Candidatus Paceibacterota bacterium]|jgi:hypothetical protein